MLRAAHAAHGSDALLLGVNMGTLGYLTEIDAPDAIDALDRVLSGDLHIEERMMLECRTDDPAMPEPAVCLNEVLLERAARTGWCASAFGSTTRASPASTPTA